MTLIRLLLSIVLLCSAAQAQRFAKQFPTIPAALAANPNDINTNYVISGRTTFDDGGGGQFYYAKGASTTTNEGTVFGFPAYPGRLIRLYDGVLNPRWFGAKGDGSTDDIDALTATVNALPDENAKRGGSIKIPEGTYPISSPWKVPTGVKIEGAGPLATIIQNLSTTTDGIQLIPSPPNTANQKIDIGNMWIWNANPTCTSGAAINLDASPTNQAVYFNLHDLMIEGGYNGIRINYALLSVLDNVTVQFCDSDGVLSEGSLNATDFRAVYSKNNGGSGFRIKSANYCKWTVCAADENAVHGYYTGDPALFFSDAVFDASGAESNGGSGFYHYNPWALKMHGCYTAFGTNSVTIIGGSGVSIESSKFEAASGWGIWTAPNTTYTGTPYAETSTNLLAGEIRSMRKISGITGDINEPFRWIRTLTNSVQRWGRAVEIDYDPSAINQLSITGNVWASSYKGSNNIVVLGDNTNAVIGQFLAGGNTYKALALNNDLSVSNSILYQGTALGAYLNAPVNEWLFFRVGGTNAGRFGPTGLLSLYNGLFVTGNGDFTNQVTANSVVGTNTGTFGSINLTSNIVYAATGVALGAGNTNIVVDYARSTWTLNQAVDTGTTNLFLTSIANAPTAANAPGLTIAILATGGNVVVYDVTSGATKLKAMQGTTFPVTITNGDVGVFSIASLLSSNVVAYSWSH